MSQSNDKCETKERSSFTGRIGYVLAVAGSAVGLGNVWRFPYLAAKYGGGIFLFVYLILAVTFGYAMIVTETALGRMTKKSPVGAYHTFGKSLPFHFGGWINAIVPMLIVPYYCVIGGWVLKYTIEYIIGNVEAIAVDGYFSTFLQSSGSVELWFILFAAMVFFTILAGVENGVERVSKVMIPLLIVLAIAVMIYSVTRPGAMDGIKYLFVPNFEDFSIMTVVSAMGQMFYSLSIAMGILVTYGSYMKKDVDIEKSTKQVEVFDTGVALISAMIVIPSVFTFSGGDMETLQAGPSLTFITLPKIFASMGMGRLVGIAFFIMFLFAALTSAISLLETCVSTCEDELHISRKKCCILMAIEMFVIGSVCALGSGVWQSITIGGMQFLDFFDFITNSVMMPIAALATVVLVVRVIGLAKLDAEVQLSGPFKRKKMFNFFLDFIAPLIIIIILISSIANMMGWISM